MEKFIKVFQSRRLRFVVLSVLLLFSIGVGYLVAHRGNLRNNSLSSHNLSSTQLVDERVKNIDKALKNAASGREDLIAFMMYDVHIDHVDFSTDGNIALVWLAMEDRSTGKVVPGELSLVIANLEGDPATWHVTFQVDRNWNEQLSRVPESLLDSDTRGLYHQENQNVAKGPVLHGYKLPWPGGLAKRITGSIGHVFVYKTCPDTCLYAFDFADGTMFPVVAARGGRVKAAVWQYPNNQSKHANFLVLEDTSTNPTTYQIYYHLAQDSIPPALRVPGTVVLQGQQIAVADNTGPSTASHLHFHVHTNPKMIWGTSVDIAFDEVTDNGGRPRTCAEAHSFPNYGSQCESGDWYVSKNGDSEKPTGGINQPLTGALIQTRKLNVTGWGKDDTQVSNIQLFTTYDGNWQPVGNPQNGSAIKTTIDLCKLGIPDGQFFLSIVVTDKSGKSSDRIGMTALQKQYNCAGPTPTPTATPRVCKAAAGQVAIFTGPQYQERCNLLGLGTYANANQLGIGDNSLDSIQVGDQVIAVLYKDSNFKGKKETLMESVPDLSSHTLGNNQVSSMKVIQRPSLPNPPTLSNPQGVDGKPATGADSLTLSWSNNGGADQFRSELTGKDGWNNSRDWSSSVTWKVGLLPPGDYSWVVEARNMAGTSQSKLDFVIQPIDKVPVSHLEPLLPQSASTALLIKWVVDQDEQDVGGFQFQFRKKGSDWQDWKPAIKGDQRQLWFLGEPGQIYQFRLRAVDTHGQTEAYTPGSEIQVHLPDTCAGGNSTNNANNEDWENAIPLDPGQEMSGNYCSVGSTHWYVFPAQDGKQYHFTVHSLGGGAASHIQLYGSDHTSLLAEKSAVELGGNTEMDWTASENSLRYVRLSPIDDRLLGNDVQYKIQIREAGVVFTPRLLFVGLLLPIVWYFTKLFKRLKKKPSDQQPKG